MDVPSASAPVSYPAVMEQRYRSRLPAALVDLAGPARGTVQLPLHVAWSGQTAFDLDSPKPRMHLYRIVLAEGQLADVTAYLNHDLLISQWPALRTLSSNTVRASGCPRSPNYAKGSQLRHEPQRPTSPTDAGRSGNWQQLATRHHWRPT
jgi:hypothetical protein